MFLWPDPADLSAPDVIRHRARWSADFPHPAARAQPPGWPGTDIITCLGFFLKVWQLWVTDLYGLPKFLNLEIFSLIFPS
jgi:hypothetical protein